MRANALILPADAGRAHRRLTATAAAAPKNQSKNLKVGSVFIARQPMKFVSVCVELLAREVLRIVHHPQHAN